MLVVLYLLPTRGTSNTLSPGTVRNLNSCRTRGGGIAVLSVNSHLETRASHFFRSSCNT